MIKKSYSDLDVVTMTKKRIKNIFDTAPKVVLCISGGKDSIVLNDLIFGMCESGEIDKGKLTVDFVDEEAIYPCVERIVKNMRFQWMSAGVKFRWWCIEVRHFNCLNSLTSEESFIIWDRFKQDVWVRNRPSFALTDHPLLRKRTDNYQDFLHRIHKGCVSLMGTRTGESVQRLKNISNQKIKDRLCPIYDWTDKDVWKYILDRQLDFPDAYLYMYRVGVSKKNMRISQFFSVDTVKNLVRVCEFYPDLFEKICRREHNAYMVLLYYDTELFRSVNKNEKKQNKNKDWKKEVLNLIKNEEYFTTPSQKKNRDRLRRLILTKGIEINNEIYHVIYRTLIGGDPKARTYRSILTKLGEMRG